MSKDAFEPVPSPFNFSQAEKDVIAFWKEGQTYHKSLAQRADAPRFVLYEGPPTCFDKNGASSRISASSAPVFLPDRAVSLLTRIGAKLFPTSAKCLVP